MALSLQLLYQMALDFKLKPNFYQCIRPGRRGRFKCLALNCGTEMDPGSTKRHTRDQHWNKAEPQFANEEMELKFKVSKVCYKDAGVYRFPRNALPQVVEAEAREAAAILILRDPTLRPRGVRTPMPHEPADEPGVEAAGAVGVVAERAAADGDEVAHEEAGGVEAVDEGVGAGEVEVEVEGARAGVDEGVAEGEVAGEGDDAMADLDETEIVALEDYGLENNGVDDNNNNNMGLHGMDVENFRLEEVHPNVEQREVEVEVVNPNVEQREVEVVGVNPNEVLDAGMDGPIVGGEEQPPVQAVPEIMRPPVVDDRDHPGIEGEENNEDEDKNGEENNGVEVNNDVGEQNEEQEVAAADELQQIVENPAGGIQEVPPRRSLRQSLGGYGEEATRLMLLQLRRNETIGKIVIALLVALIAILLALLMVFLNYRY